jgi:hypothetical protein
VPPTTGALETLLPHLEALEAIARGRAVPDARRSAGQFEALFKAGEGGPARPASEDTVRRLGDILDAVAEAASLAPMDDRPREAVLLLEHLLALYGISLTQYADAIKSRHVDAGLERVRLLCRPYT